MYVDGANAFELTGLGRGGQQIQKAKETYQKAVEVLVELASLQVRGTLLFEPLLHRVFFLSNLVN